MDSREQSKWRVADVEYTPDLTSWRVLRDGGPWGEFAFSLAGEYNVLNATAAAAVAANYGICRGRHCAGLRSFRSVKRRLEVKAEVHGITIIDDFAHHPTAIAETLKALRTRYAGRRLWAILEPRSNTLRRKVFRTSWRGVCRWRIEVVLAGMFKSEAIPEHERLDAAAVIAKLRASGKPARLLDTADAIVDSIAPELRNRRCRRYPVQWGIRRNLREAARAARALHEVSTPA